MSHVRRSTVALAVLGTTCLGPATAAQATADLTAAPALLQSNWYWHKVQADTPGSALPAAPEPSDVPDGDLPVASRDGSGTASKLSLVAFDLPKDAGSVSAFDVTLTIDPNAQNLTSENPKLAAELVLRNWANGKGGDADTVNAPPLQAVGAVQGTVSADGKSYVFHVPALATAWVDDANFGLAVVPAKGYTTPFQLSFLGGKAVKAQMSYAPAVATPATSSATGSSAPTTAGGTTTSSGPLGSSFPSLGGLTSQPSLGGVVPPSLAAPSVAAPVTAAPQVAPPAATPLTTAAALRSVSSRPSTGLVVLGAAVALLLALVSLILGGEPEAVAARRTSRLSRVLTARAARPAARRTAAVA